ncbi:MAG: PPC domain-containing protein [Lewinellaceae bacterium]|nr:PPC domain-containing protein [Saprospiraceae bacterium]MCB9339936.1 PPC domain-containing protein [Lewinellaceae bacterium]
MENLTLLSNQSNWWQMLIPLAFVFLLPLPKAFSNPINYGDDLTSSILVLGEEDTYTFSGTSGDKIIIRMRGISSSFEACLTLKNPSNAVVSSSCAGGLSEINVTLTETGTYTIVAADDLGDDTGNYGLSLQILNNAAYTQALPCGNDLTVSINHLAGMESFSLAINNGDKLRIQARPTTGAFLTKIQLYNPLGALATSAVENVNGLALIDNYVANMTGDYILVILEENGYYTSTVGISFQKLNDPSCAQPLGCGDDQTVSIGQLADIKAFSLMLNSGDKMRFKARGSSSNITTQLQLYNPAGMLVATAVKDGDGVAEIDNYEAATTGDHILLLSDVIGGYTSSVGISFQKLNAAACTQSISCGDSLTIQLNNQAEMESFSFFATAGNTIDIIANAQSSSFDEVIEIFDPCGNLVASTIASSGVAMINDFIVPITGEYTFIISDDSGYYTSSVGLSISGPCTGTTLCSTNLMLNSNPIPSNIYKSADTINSAGTVAAGSDVTFKAGDSNTLEAGFTVELGSIFLAAIEACQLP